ncbi:MAG: phospholipid carrier-dependent glycosyltransferase [Leptolyngbyaceae cyanobacterium bins.349]|nr:phospholipid carrier-dependent glycosyltransferase [Leptolyngbyaceae cyanobacterium bins.349]
MRGKNRRGLTDLLLLAGIWLAVVVCDRLWLALDRSTPAWDAADYLTGSLVYWQALQTPQWFSGQWWTNLWLLSSKIPPFVYISTAPFISVFGKMPDQMILVFLAYSAVLLGSVYWLGTYLFNRRVGLWAAVFCIFMPVFFEARLEYLLDYPLAAMVALAFLGLTYWWGESGPGQAGEADAAAVGNAATGEQDKDVWERLQQRFPAIFARLSAVYPFLQRYAFLRPWGLAIAAGIGLGLAFMTKQTAGLFLVVPVLWCVGQALWSRHWKRLAQLGLMFLASLPIWFPWYRTNWLLILTSSKRATIDSAAIQGSPSLLTLDAWTFYLRYLPLMVSVPLIVVPLLGLLFFWRRSRVGRRWQCSVDYDPQRYRYREVAFESARRSLVWLLVFMAGGYLLSTLNPNKDLRYFSAGLPVLAVILAYGFTLLPRSWRLVQWASMALAGLLMLVTLFPIFAHAHPTTLRYPNQHFPQPGDQYPHADVISEVRLVAPYLRSTIGVLPSTPEVNQHNVNYFGLTQAFQVYGRQVGTRKANLIQDRRSIDWFLTKTGNQGSMRQPDLQAAMVQSVEQGNEFILQKSWSLPDSSQLKLYHRRLPPIEVKPPSETQLPESPALTQPVQLKRVTVPAEVLPGKPVPVTYEWSGAWQAMQTGLVVITWKRRGEAGGPGRDRWLHDHGLGLGMLYPERPKQVNLSSQFQLTERLAMLPPADAIPGTYELDVVYLHRPTGKTTPIPAPKVTLRVNPTATPTVAPELDLLTQLRMLAGTLPKGPQSLERISNEINRINQYDPVQDYLTQSQLAMQYRLQAEPRNRNYAYTLALATVLKRQVNAAIAALQHVTQIDPDNPYAHAYLAFVNLYDFRPGTAQDALNTARDLNPSSPEIQALSGIAALMRGNLVQAWHYAQAYQKAHQLRG